MCKTSKEQCGESHMRSLSLMLVMTPWMVLCDLLKASNGKRKKHLLILKI